MLPLHHGFDMHLTLQEEYMPNAKIILDKTDATLKTSGSESIFLFSMLFLSEGKDAEFSRTQLLIIHFS